MVALIPIMEVCSMPGVEARGQCSFQQLRGTACIALFGCDKLALATQALKELGSELEEERRRYRTLAMRHIDLKAGQKNSCLMCV